jgi:pimeloyl-ACP methyl ester carboxylesterase
MQDTEAVDHLRAAAETARITGIEFVAPDQYDVTLPDMRLHVLDWGGPSDQVVLLLHGGGLTAHTWDLVCLSLRTAGYHCIAPDLRGHGDSAWAAEQQYHVSDYTRDVAGLVDHLELDQFVLVGMSLGGMTAIHYAAAHSARLAGLVLIDVGPEMSGGGRERMRNFAETTTELDSIDAYVAQAMLFNPRRNPDLLRRSLMHNLRQGENGKWSWKYDPQRQRAMGDDPARRAEAAWGAVDRIDCPTLVVRGGDSDMFSPANAEALVGRLQQVEFVEVPGAGHTVQGDQPRVLSDALRDYLAGLSWSRSPRR